MDPNQADPPIILFKSADTSDKSANELVKLVLSRLLRLRKNAWSIRGPACGMAFSDDPVVRAEKCSIYRKVMESEARYHEIGFYHTFHNYPLSDEFGNRRPDFSAQLRIREESRMISPVSVQSGKIVYDFNTVESIQDQLSDESIDGLFNRVEGVSYWIPAYFTDHNGRRNVDVDKTRAHGFLDDAVVDLLGGIVLKLHQTYSRILINSA